MAWASIPPCSPRPGYFLVSRKTPTTVGFSLRRKDKKPRFSSFRWCSLAAFCRRVAVSVCRWAVAPNVLMVRPLAVFLVALSRPEHREARAASRGTAHRHQITWFPSACASGFAAGGFPVGSREAASPIRPLAVFLVALSRPEHREARGASRGTGHWHQITWFSSACASGFAAGGFPVGSREVPLPNRPLLWACEVNERGGARALKRAPEASEAWRAKRSERAVNGGQGRPT